MGDLCSTVYIMENEFQIMVAIKINKSIAEIIALVHKVLFAYTVQVTLYTRFWDFSINLAIDESCYLVLRWNT